MIRITSLFTNRSLALIYLVVMCTQILIIEGFGVSPLKVFLMGLSPLVLLIKVPYLSKALFVVLYVCSICLRYNAIVCPIFHHWLPLYVLNDIRDVLQFSLWWGLFFR